MLLKLPSSWTITKLGDICEIVSGGLPKPMCDSKYFYHNLKVVINVRKKKI